MYNNTATVWRYRLTFIPENLCRALSVALRLAKRVSHCSPNLCQALSIAKCVSCCLPLSCVGCAQWTKQSMQVDSSHTHAVEERVFLDTALPFGLRSAPKLFNALADAIEWCAKNQGASQLWHYLDDFITIGRACTEECEFNKKVLHHVCTKLGVPLATDKCKGPTTCLTFLGIKN